ncbi:MAG: DUF4861 domain-containing protein [Prevotella sp.]|nr:DUF4861 domain-containing protein [Prevotella sp.]MBQ1800938.1 DUF4861 domain-containing protein [Prevotella sp.]MBQ2132145.1 DUF4861 domain-containing protein [Prevotella sp.]MBQ2215719.1 DUF4861 domain-containing protein [Prevotella sp.]MBQ4028463.1 DUF4861 domain-containing protein [Prevotella sp.]
MKIKSAILSLILMLPMTSWAGKTVTITVTNDENEQRQELVEIDLKTIVDKLALGEDDAFVVRNAFGQQVDYQVTYDGKLLIDVSVRPCGKAQFTVSKGVPEPMKTWVKGKMYPTRKDDIAWENDRGAYRVYGPALQRTGEKSFGTDVWTKNTPEIVVEDRYTADYDGNILKNIYHKKGQGDKWRDEDLHTSFHLDHGNGLDCYSVGSTLGCGTPALMDGNTLIYPYCYKEYEILDNGPLRFTVALTYHPAKVKKDENVVEHRIMSLDKGSNFNKITVWYEGLTKPCDFASGVVIHSEDKESVVLGSNYVHYADPTDNPAKHNFQVYVAALFPYGDVKTKMLKYDTPNKGIEGHALGILKKLENNQKYTYYAGSAWSKADVRTQREWQVRIDSFLNAIAMPLEVTIE